MKYIDLIISIIFSVIWIGLHATGVFEIDLISIIFPCIWFIIVSLRISRSEKKEKTQ